MRGSSLGSKDFTEALSRGVVKVLFAPGEAINQPLFATQVKEVIAPSIPKRVSRCPIPIDEAKLALKDLRSRTPKPSVSSRKVVQEQLHQCLLQAVYVAV